MASLDWDDPLRNLGPITEHPAPNSPISDEPSSALSDLEGFESIRERAERLLSVYRPISPDDRTVEILKIFLAHLPKEGQTALLSDIIAIGNNEADLRTLRSHLVDAILKPMKIAGGKQPKTPITAPSNPLALEQINLSTTRFESSDRTQQGKLKKDCLKRDGFRCMVSGLYGLPSLRNKKFTLPAGGGVATTQCAHILPFALRHFDEAKAAETRNKAIIWWALHRYFPALKGKIDAMSINQHANLMTMEMNIHDVFGASLMAFWPTEEENGYSILSIEGLPFPYTVPKGQKSVLFTSRDPQVPLPDKDFLKVHCRVAKILEVSGIGRIVEDELEVALEDPSNLRPDGSTDVGSILRRAMLMNI